MRFHDLLSVAPKFPTHALMVIDNSIGESDQYFVFAFKHEGKWINHEHLKPVIEYEGDQVLMAWALPLDHCKQQAEGE